MGKSSLFVTFLTITVMTCLVGGCGGGGGGGNGDADTALDRQWTYLVYMGADNNLSNYGIADIEEMAQVGSSDEVAIVVQAEFSPSYTTGIPDTSTYRGLVQQGTIEDNLEVATNLGNVDMGSPEALTDFIVWATTNYPAQHYALVIWDHGSGWKNSPKLKASVLRGAVQDDTSGTFMNLPDLGNAVRNAGIPMDIINFDACLMGMYEVAYEFNGLTNYLVASEESEPGNGDPYDTILGDLAAQPAMTAADLSAVMVDRYAESYENYSATGRLTTKSALDMSQLSIVDAAVMTLGQALMNDADSNTVAMAARSNTQNYSYPANHDIHDLASYIFNEAPDGAAKNAAATLMSAVKAAVYRNGITPDSAASTNNGLAIYMPTSAQTSSFELAEYATLACNATSRGAISGSWGEYLQWLIDQEGGGTSGNTLGDFTVTLRWTTPEGEPCDADLDLNVYEPGDGDFEWPHSALFMPNSSNGTFSADSYSSGEPVESYHANHEIEAGYYDFSINYYLNGDTCNQALAKVYFNNGTQQGDGTLIGSATMDLSNSYWDDYDDIPGCYGIDGSMGDFLKCMSDYYSDLFYAGYVHASDANGGTPPIMTTKPAKGRQAVVFKKKLLLEKPVKPALTQ